MQIKKLFIVSVLTLLLAGCSQIFPPAMYSPKAIGELTTDLKKISENYKIENVRVYEKDKLSNEFGMAMVIMSDSEDKKFEQVLYYNYGIPHNDPKPAKGYTKGKQTHPINVDDIIARKDSIEKYVEEARNYIEEESEGKYKFESVTDLTFTTDKAGDLLIKFTVNVTEKGKSSRMEGGRQVTDYYGLDFSVDKDGNIAYED